jgi:hypothetical protein
MVGGGEMRIVKSDARVFTGQDDGGEYGRAFSILDTIEISDADLNTIFGYFIANEVVRAGYEGVDGNTLNFETRKGITFAQYLKSLISLAGEGRKE